MMLVAPGRAPESGDSPRGPRLKCRTATAQTQKYITLSHQHKQNVKINDLFHVQLPIRTNSVLINVCAIKIYYCDNHNSHHFHLIRQITTHLFLAARLNR